VESDKKTYVIGQGIGEIPKAIDIKSFLSDYADRFDPDKLAAEDAPS
jgi:hypothetical protein